MKRYIVICFALLLLKFDVCGYNLSHSDYKELVTQFSSLVEYNTENIKNGHPELNHYLFVYNPGAEYIPSMPVDLTYIFESPTGITPEGEALDNILKYYNDRDDDFPYQHYFIVVNLTYVIQSALYENNEPLTEDPAWYKSIYDDESVRDFEDYDYASDQLQVYFKANYPNDVFAPNHQNLVSFFIVSHENTLGQNELLLANKRTELWYFGGNSNTNEFNDKVKDFVIKNKNNNIGTGLSSIKSTLSNYIKEFYLEEGLSSTACELLADRILYANSRDFFNFRCTQEVEENLNKKNALFVSSLYLDYLESIFVTVYEEDHSQFEFNNTLIYIASILGLYLDLENPGPYDLYLKGVYNDYWLLQLPELQNNYFRLFYDINQPTPLSFIQQVETNVLTIDRYYNDLGVIESAFPPIELIGGLIFANGKFTTFEIESAWKSLSTLFEQGANGVYENSELITMLDGIKLIPNIESILYTKWLTGDESSSYWIETDQRTGGTNLSNFIVRANLAKAELVIDDQNPQFGFKMYNIPYRYNDNFISGPEESNLIGDLTKTISGDYKYYDYNIMMCERLGLEDVSIEIFDEPIKLFVANGCASFVSESFEYVGFFDQVNLITLRNHFAIENFCYDSGQPENWHDAHPVAGFYLSFSQDRDIYTSFYKLLSKSFEMGLAYLTYGEYLQAKGSVKTLYGLFTAANITALYTVSEQEEFEEDLKKWMVNDQDAQDIASLVTSVNTALLYIEVAVGMHQISNSLAALLTTTKYKKTAAFSTMLNDAIGNVDGNILLDYNEVRRLGQGTLSAYLSRNEDLTNFESIYHGLYGVENVQRLKGAAGTKIKDLILQARFSGTPYKNIHEQLNTLDAADRLESLSNDLLSNPQLVPHLSDGGEAIVNSKLRTWNELSLAEVPDSYSKSIDAIEDVRSGFEEGLDATDAVDDAVETVEIYNPTWPQVRQNYLRGNTFNRTVRDLDPPVYDYHEVTVKKILPNGEEKRYRLDSYNVDLSNEGLEIVSRKATDFDNIQVATFQKYISELVNKYQVGLEIVKPGFPINGKLLKGSYKLEVPISNLTSTNLSLFESIAAQSNVEIIFKAE